MHDDSSLLQRTIALYTLPLHLVYKGIILFLFSACFSDNQNVNEINTLPELPEKLLPEPQPVTEHKQPVEFLIALTGEVRGEIEPCGCPTLPYGGFERREVFLNEVRENHIVFHMDAGEMLLKGFSSEGRKNQEEREALLLSLSEAVSLDVWTVGPSDLSVLAPPYSQYSNAISASFTNKEGDLLFPPAIVLEKDAIRIGVIGLSAAPSSPRSNQAYLPPETALKRGLEALPNDLDLVVALGSLSGDAIKQLAKAPSGVSLFLTTKGDALNSPIYPDASSSSMIIETPDRGRYIQNIYIRLGAEGSHPIEALEDEQVWRDHILSAEDSKLHLIGSGRNLAYTELVPLNKSYDQTEAVSSRSLIEEFKSVIRKKSILISQKQPTPTEPGYATAGHCSTCHTKEFAGWTFTEHPRAWETLIKEGEENNPECIGCHSTGYGEVEGFGELSATNIQRFKGVQCEACHGPLKGHPSNGLTPEKITENVCLNCHDEANSPSFQYDSYIRHATCHPIETP
jgi:predicted CXXCH cytochrome family protein